VVRQSDQVGQAISVELLGHALDAMAAGALVVDGDGLILFANSAARTLLRPQPPEGRRVTEALPGAGLTDLAAAAETGDQIRIALERGPAIEIQPRALVPGTYVLTLSRVRTDGGDPLTGLCDRSRLHAELGANLARIRRGGAPLAVLCLDLDRFKEVNDTLGHPVGDALLRRVADRLRKTVRGEDLVARIGGDEFVIIQTNTRDPQAAEALARRLVERVCRPYVIEGNAIVIGVSIGIAKAPCDGEEPDVLLKHADLALYRAKAEGRGKYRFFEPEMDAQVKARRALERDLRSALPRRQFHLVFQPQIGLESDHVEGFEALLRWTHPRRGAMPPGEFIPVAEECGLMDQIGGWVLSAACGAASAWPPPAAVAVNVSAVQFRRGCILPAVTEALEAAGLPPDRLELEITEAALLQDPDSVCAVLRELRALGVRISLDDFGTGYASLSHLQRFAFDKIKIDRTFVQSLARDPDRRAIVRALAGLGASLGIRIVAEGVETPEQLAQLRADGCSGVQGYLTGRPLSAEAATALVTAQRLVLPARATWA
jgi:diguanylate cyclase (GGDEF)-like protein